MPFVENEMRTKILKAAFNLIGKKSVKDVSMQEIATACNITKPSLYYYFKDKDELCYTIIRYVLDEQNKRMKKYFEQNLSLKDILIDIFQNTYNAKTKKMLEFFLHMVNYIKGVPVLEKKFKPLKSYAILANSFKKDGIIDNFSKPLNKDISVYKYFYLNTFLRFFKKILKISNMTDIDILFLPFLPQII